MGHPIFPFEIILEVATYLDVATLNALVQTNKRAAAALTDRLYGMGILDKVIEAESEDSSDESETEDLPTGPVTVFDEKVWPCVSRWTSDLVVSSILAKLKYDSKCIKLEVDPLSPADTISFSVSYPLLHLMSAVGNLTIVRALIEAGAPVNALDKDLATPLHSACDEAHEDVARYLLDSGADVLLLDGEGRSVIHCASRAASPSLLTCLIEATRAAGGDPFRQRSNGSTPLYIAACHANVDAMRLYLELGADPAVANQAGIYPIDCRQITDHEPIIKQLVQRTLERGGDISYRDEEGRTLLHRATRWEKPNLIRYFLECGADVMAVANDGRTPLHDAIRWGDADSSVVECLLDWGADPTFKDGSRFGRTPFETGTSHGNWRELTPLLLRGNPRAWPEDHINMKLWRAAARGRQLERNPLVLLKRLVRNGSSAFDEVDPAGNTALHLLCGVQNPEPDSVCLEMIRILLDAGADPVATSYNGTTPFLEALLILTVARSSNTHIVRLLLEHPGIHGQAREEELDYDGTIQALRTVPWGVMALAADDERRKSIRRAVEKIHDQKLAKRVKRLLGS